KARIQQVQIENTGAYKLEAGRERLSEGEFQPGKDSSEDLPPIGVMTTAENMRSIVQHFLDTSPGILVRSRTTKCETHSIMGSAAGSIWIPDTDHAGCN